MVDFEKAARSRTMPPSAHSSRNIARHNVGFAEHDPSCRSKPFFMGDALHDGVGVLDQRFIDADYEMRHTAQLPEAVARRLFEQGVRAENATERIASNIAARKEMAKWGRLWVVSVLAVRSASAGEQCLRQLRRFLDKLAPAGWRPHSAASRWPSGETDARSRPPRPLAAAGLARC